MLRLLTILFGAGMFAAGFAVIRAAFFRLLRHPRVPAVHASTGPTPTWVVANVPLSRHLTEPQLARLITKATDLLSTRSWSGCGGLLLTDEIRFTIASQAALLVLEQPGEPYPRLREILVYPATFQPRHFSWTPSAETHDRSATLGQSWDHGIVVLAWDAARHGTVNPFDADNVILHEFSHQLDTLDGEADGIPTLPSHMPYEAWTTVLADEFQRLNRAVDRGQRTVLDEYGASQHAEFFAVATEAFFEKPRQLQRKHPALYAQLKGFYSQDPAAPPPRTGA